MSRKVQHIINILAFNNGRTSGREGRENETEFYLLLSVPSKGTCQEAALGRENAAPVQIYAMLVQKPQNFDLILCIHTPYTRRTTFQKLTPQEKQTNGLFRFRFLKPRFYLIVVRWKKQLLPAMYLITIVTWEQCIREWKNYWFKKRRDNERVPHNFTTKTCEVWCQELF